MQVLTYIFVIATLATIISYWSEAVGDLVEWIREKIRKRKQREQLWNKVMENPQEVKEYLQSKSETS